MLGQPFACGLARREQLLAADLETELGEAREQSLLRLCGGVGDEAQRESRFVQSCDRLDGARQHMVALIDNAREVEEHATDHGVSLARMGVRIKLRGCRRIRPINCREADGSNKVLG